MPAFTAHTRSRSVQTMKNAAACNNERPLSSKFRDGAHCIGLNSLSRIIGMNTYDEPFITATITAINESSTSDYRSRIEFRDEKRKPGRNRDSRDFHLESTEESPERNPGWIVITRNINGDSVRTITETSRRSSLVFRPSAIAADEDLDRCQSSLQIEN